MKTALMVTQIVFSILLCFAVLLQQRGSGLSAVFGGSGTSFHSTKRGAEKFLVLATIVLAILFVANSIAFLFV